MAKMGRPKKELNLEKLELLCSFPFTQEEIGWILGLSVDTLANEIRKLYNLTFSEFCNKKRNDKKIQLYNKQFEVAMSGSVPMLIWLGKQILNQKEPTGSNDDNPQEVKQSVYQLHTNKSEPKAG